MYSFLKRLTSLTEKASSCLMMTFLYSGEDEAFTKRLIRNARLWVSYIPTPSMIAPQKVQAPSLILYSEIV